MAELALGDCRIAIDASFRHDTSTFVAPAEEGVSARLAGKKSLSFRPNVVVTRASEPVHLTPIE